jgi:two-component system cell cycle response regulator
MTARILVIEDNPANLELMLYLLKAFGYDTLAAGDGEEGLAVALREMPDLIICDLQLPKLHGMEVARQLKSNAQFHIPIVAVTAFAMVGDRDRILAAGFDGYIPKPLNPETFVRDVEAFLKPADRLTGRPLARSWPNQEAAKEDATAVEERPTILSVDNSHINLSLA